MPKIINYPRTSFQKCLDLADAADSLGGSCDKDTCAEKMGLKVTGSFTAAIADAQKFNLIDYEKGTISVTDQYKLIKHSYSEEERKIHLSNSFLEPEVYDKLYDKFLGRVLPSDMLDKILIREFDVDEKNASRVSNYFIDGLEEFNLIDDKGVVNAINNPESKVSEAEITDNSSKKDSNISEKFSQQLVKKDDLNNHFFTVHINGPGLNSQIRLTDENDFLILEATLNKAKNELKKGSE